MKKEELLKAVNLGKSILSIWQYGFPEDKSLHNALVETKNYVNGVSSLSDLTPHKEAAEAAAKFATHKGYMGYIPSYYGRVASTIYSIIDAADNDRQTLPDIHRQCVDALKGYVGSETYLEKKKTIFAGILEGKDFLLVPEKIYRLFQIADKCKSHAHFGVPNIIFASLLDTGPLHNRGPIFIGHEYNDNDSTYYDLIVLYTEDDKGICIPAPLLKQEVILSLLRTGVDKDIERRSHEREYNSPETGELIRLWEEAYELLWEMDINIESAVESILDPHTQPYEVAMSIIAGETRFF